MLNPEPGQVYILYQRGCTAPTTADAGIGSGLPLPLTEALSGVHYFWLSGPCQRDQ